MLKHAIHMLTLPLLMVLAIGCSSTDAPPPVPEPTATCAASAPKAALMDTTPAPSAQTTTAPTTTAPTTTAPTTTAPTAAPTTATPAQITFYGDILPILSSNATGSAYRCTTCHANYGAPGGLSNVNEVNRIVESLEKGRMPRTGDAVPEAAINLFRTWQLQGFQTGTARLTKVSNDQSVPDGTTCVAQKS